MTLPVASQWPELSPGAAYSCKRGWKSIANNHCPAKSEGRRGEWALGIISGPCCRRVSGDLSGDYPGWPLLQAGTVLTAPFVGAAVIQGSE